MHSCKVGFHPAAHIHESRCRYINISHIKSVVLNIYSIMQFTKHSCKVGFHPAVHIHECSHQV
jgi:hypothetical protein